jgi:large subunit ribosomal protein L29
MQIDEIRKLTDEELQKTLEDSQRSLMNLQFRKATMQLSNVVEIKSVRKDIAKIQTIIKQRQILGTK